MAQLGFKEMKTFKLEEYLTKHEFSAPYLLCCSDAESFSVAEILAMAELDEQKLWHDLRLSYTEPYGHPLLRETIASSLYPGFNQDNILCFAGAEEGIFASLHTLCEPCDHVIVLTPCYQSLLETPQSKGAEVTQIQLKEEHNWRIDLNEIKKAIKPNTKCVVINFPHNPTGQVITQEEMESLSNICDQNGLWLFSDEVYRLLGQPKTPWAQPAAVGYHKAISLGVMSKAFGLAGLRIGWIACQDKEILHKIKLMKDYLSICNSAPSEVLSLIALKNKDQILSRNNKIVADNLLLIDAFIAEYNNLFSWVRPQGGCVGFINYQPHTPVSLFCDQLIKETGVLLMPASIYDLESNHFRVGFGRKNMPDALEKLRAFLSK